SVWAGQPPEDGPNGGRTIQHDLGVSVAKVALAVRQGRAVTGALPPHKRDWHETQERRVRRLRRPLLGWTQVNGYPNPDRPKPIVIGVGQGVQRARPEHHPIADDA